jgi:hypothetical protein
VEAGSAFDGVAFVGDGGASLADDVVEFVDGRDMFVDDRLVDQRPNARLSSLWLRPFAIHGDET